MSPYDTLVREADGRPFAAIVAWPVEHSRSPALHGFVQDGDTLAVDFEKGLVSNETRGTTLRLEPLPPLMRDIIEAGGGIGFMKQRLSQAATTTDR